VAKILVGDGYDAKFVADWVNLRAGGRHRIEV